MKKTFRVFHALHQAHTAVFSAANKTLKRREAILTAHQTILFILCHEDGIPSSLLAARTDMSKTRLTGLVDTLEGKGLIRRERGKKDARQQIIFIQPEGRALVDRTKGWAHELNERLLEDFNDEERVIIQKFLQNVTSKAASRLDV